MFSYVLRRIIYAIPILIGVNVITFVLFFMVNTPDDMARMQLGQKHITTEAIQQWKIKQEYDKPLFYNTQNTGIKKITNTLFFQKSFDLFSFHFGRSMQGRDIRSEERRVGKECR